MSGDLPVSAGIEPRASGGRSTVVVASAFADGVRNTGVNRPCRPMSPVRTLCPLRSHLLFFLAVLDVSSEIRYRHAK